MFKLSLISVFKLNQNSCPNLTKTMRSSRSYSQTIESTQCCRSSKTIAKLNVKNALRSEPSEHLVSISGWVRSLRKQKPMFLHVNDGSVDKHIQVVINEEVVELPKKSLTKGCCVRCVGQLTASPGPKQPIELNCRSIEVLGECDPEEYPIKHSGQTYKLQYFRDYLHLRVRNPLFSSLARIRSEAINAIHIYMKQNDFFNVTTPAITSNDCEGGGHVFTIKSPYCNENTKYFEKEAFLTVSAQLHLEAMVGALSRVYTLSPCFRAERSMSRKHLSEFLMLEAEEAFIDSVDQLMDRVETVCKFIAYYTRMNCDQDFNVVFKETNYKYFDNIVNKKYIRITYEEAIKTLQKMPKFSTLSLGHNLNAEQELALVESLGNIPVFVTHFPSEVKPFYMKRENQNALCFDLLSPIAGEICGGSVREDSLEELESRIINLKSERSLNWYLDLRRFGNQTHGGFGIGFDRLIQTISGMNHIRDVNTFPRFWHNCDL